MSRTHQRKGFTLIEVMISIALLAIALPVTFHCINSFQWFSHEENYKYALFQARTQAAELMRLPFDSLPPEEITVPPGGRISLSQGSILPETIKIFRDGKAVSPFYFRFREGDLELHSSLAGAKILIEYEYLLPDAREASTIPEKAPHEVKLLNSPVRKVLEIKRAEGPVMAAIPASLYRVDYNRGVIAFDSALAGKVVEFSYLGGRMSTRAVIHFAGESLNHSYTPTDLKLITIEEAYGKRVNNFSITMLRARR